MQAIRGIDPDAAHNRFDALLELFQAAPARRGCEVRSAFGCLCRLCRGRFGTGADHACSVMDTHPPM